MDLASFEVVKSCQKTLKALLAEGLVDIVFCNEEEAEALCEVSISPHPHKLSDWIFGRAFSNGAISWSNG